MIQITAGQIQDVSIQTIHDKETVLIAIQLAEAYVEFIEHIRPMIVDFSKGENRIDIAIDILMAAKKFFESQPNTQNSNLMAPLTAIAAALHDVKSGIWPSLFPVKGSRKGTKGKDATYTHVVSSTAAACMSVLMASGRSASQASTSVCRALNRIGIKNTYEGREIRPDTIESWRERISANKSPARKTYDNIMKEIKKSQIDITDTTQAERTVKGLITGLHESGAALPKIPQNPS